MSTNELVILENKANTIIELEDAAKELLDEAEVIKNEIKMLMSEKGETEVVTD